MSSREKNDGFGEYEKYHMYDVGLGLRLPQHQLNHVFSPASGEGMTRMAFTANQRQELERQTVIYKYIMASMPVPPELIIPLSKYPSPNLPPLLHHTDHSSSRRAMELRYSGGGGRGGGIGDAEPWRCKRTDGKKWRCSRDVAPNLKYCERHSHKGRPSARSRKPVESSSHVSSAPTTTTSTTTTTAASNPISLNPFQHHSTSYDLPSSLRYPEWFTKEEGIVPTAQVLYPQQIEPFSVERRGGRGHSRSHSHSSPLPRPFIDAWSLEDVHKNKCPNTSSSTITNLPLTLSMSPGFDPDTRQANPKEDDHAIRQQPPPLNWMSSWTNMPSGGPLAEALCLGMSGTTNAWGNPSDELVSPHGHSSSSTGTTMSSKGSHASADTSGQGFHLH